EGLALARIRRLAGPLDDVLGLLTRLAQALAVLGEQLIRLVTDAFGVVDRLLDGVLAAVERVGDPREGQLPQDVHRDAEQQQGPDHQPDAGRDQERAAGGGDRWWRYGSHLLEHEGEQAGDEAVEEHGFGEREAQPLDAGDLVAHLGLAADRSEHLAADDADADAGADRTET